MREPYAMCQRAPKGDPEQLADIQQYVDQLHWPKTLDQADDGTIYVSNGGSQSEMCDPTLPFHGGILALDPQGSNGVRQIAKGMRNPMYVRCHHDGHNLCFASELAKDYSAGEGGREKLLVIHEGDDWGYPCCASQGLPYTDVCLGCSALTDTQANSTQACKNANQCSPKCAAVVNDTNSFIIGNTPFGLDFAEDQFPSPFKHVAVVALHGEFASWKDAKVVTIGMDPATGQMLPSSSITGMITGAEQDFITGWDDGMLDHGRPSDVAVSRDGRIFISNDVTGEIIWAAPVQ
jgi:glucose/arabinose dehydrogenase